MKIKKIISALTLLCAVLLVSCDSPTFRGKASQGGPYEILVVADHTRWESALGDSIQSVLKQQIPWINSPEAMYRVMRIAPTSFSGLMREHRNILLVATGSDYPEPRLVSEYDKYAFPQLIVTAMGPDIETLAAYVGEHRNELQTIFEMAERDRDLNNNSKYIDITLQLQIYEKFGFWMDIPKGYLLAGSSDNFMWIRQEYPLASQGILIYSYPYKDISDFYSNPIIERRNEFAARVPGPNEGSYMTTFMDYYPEATHMRIHGRLWAEQRGFWDVEGDYMGGPFVNYSTLDADNRRVIGVDMFVFSPRDPKRGYLRSLEHLIYSIKFPGDEVAD